MLTRRLLGVFTLVSSMAVGPAFAVPPGSFAAFESGPVRPLALSPDGTRLFATNTPDNQLEIFAVDAAGLEHIASVSVGLEPVAVAARSNSEVWVVNHLSDSVSIVDVAADPPHVVRTLLVGDEPRDIVFAGPSDSRAFITTARRGQQRTHASIAGVPGAGDPLLTTPGVGRADVWVFDATDLGNTLGGTPVKIVELFGDTPRALARSADGNTVYAAVHFSGNQTTVVPEGAVCDGGQFAGPCVVAGRTMPGGLPPPNTDAQGIPAPEVGLIVKYNATLDRWEDELGRDWSPAVDFNLPDLDVFAIDAGAANPNDIVETAAFPGVGTILFNMIVHPTTGNVYVTNTEARNEVRFEGPGIFADTTVRGRLHEARITVLDIAGFGAIEPRHLNKHIDYNTVPSPAGTADQSLATPLDMALDAGANRLYVAAFGSSKVGVYDIGELEADTFDPAEVEHIEVSGGGPSGLVLDPTHDRLYVLTRFNNAVAVVDTTSGSETATLPLHNPEPHRVVAGRRFLYDARLTSSNGEASCSSCHVFGDLDHLGWDLGDPDEVVLNNPNPFEVNQLPPPAIQAFPDFHPMKGPMATQSLRGMANHGPMHWRGDRTGGNDIGGDPLSEDQAFKKFNGAFEGLLGREHLLTAAEMQAFTDFILEVTYPPNPIRAIDNSLTPAEAAGEDFFFNNDPSDVVRTCNGCHVLDPAQGFFGSKGFSSFENETQFFKVAHLRNLYQKVGMFGMVDVPFFNVLNTPHQGDQIRGFGFLHDGSVDTVFRFVNATVFNQSQFGLPFNSGGFANGPAGHPARRDMEAFMLAFDSNFNPVVGQQITLDDGNAGVVGARIDVLIARAAAGECDLVVKGTIGGEQRGWLRLDDGDFHGDRAAEPPLSDGALRALAATPGQQLTYTCVPPGSGRRIAIDRDGDLMLDGDERDAGSNPGNPRSLPAGVVLCGSGAVVDKGAVQIRKNSVAAGQQRITLKGEFVLAQTDDPIDPIEFGFSFRVDDKDGNTVFSRVVPGGVPPERRAPGWKVNRPGTRWTFRDRSGSLADGVTVVTVLDRGKRNPGQYAFKVTGKDGDFQVDTAALPLKLVVVLGDGYQTSVDQCAERGFNPSEGVRPRCSAAGRGGIDRIVCR